MNLRNFFAELKRRNVYKVAVAYAVVGWLLIQVATQVFPFFEIPNLAVRLVELTPEGIKRAEDVSPAAEEQARSHAWIYVVAIGAALSIGLFFLGRYSARDSASAARVEAATAIPQKSIAVLPFENLSDDKGAAYFADGIQDGILTKLASIADLKVISRTSTAKYKSKPEDLRTVSLQLGVATVLEGSVQSRRAGDATSAIEILGRLLAIPAGHEVTIFSLKTNPVWDPIRSEPGFQRLLAGTEQVGP